MVPVYALATVLGVAALIAWIGMTVFASTVPGSEGRNPEQRFGPTGRLAVAALVGFGFAGMSASFAGWTWLAALGAAAAGAAGAGLVARYLGPESEETAVR
jgi:hypothetical protein